MLVPNTSDPNYLAWLYSQIDQRVPDAPALEQTRPVITRVTSTLQGSGATGVGAAIVWTNATVNREENTLGAYRSDVAGSLFIPRSGIFYVRGAAHWAVNAVGVRVFNVIGSTVGGILSSALPTHAVGGVGMDQSDADELFIPAGETLTFNVLQTSGGALNVTAYLTIKESTSYRQN